MAPVWAASYNLFFGMVRFLATSVIQTVLSIASSALLRVYIDVLRTRLRSAGWLPSSWFIRTLASAFRSRYCCWFLQLAQCIKSLHYVMTMQTDNAFGLPLQNHSVFRLGASIQVFITFQRTIRNMRGKNWGCWWKVAFRTSYSFRL